MDFQTQIIQIRKDSGLTQDEFAAKLFVTRQAVSRWEKGETTPNIDTLKAISKLFDVSINTLLGQPRAEVCVACGMPLAKDEDFALSDPTKNYCRYCAKEDGSLKSWEEQLEVCIIWSMNEYNMTREVAEIETPKYLKTLPAWKDK